MIARIALLIISVGIAVFFTRRVMRFLRYFQQEEYDGFRFISWLFRTRSFDKRGTLVCLVGALWSWAWQTETGGIVIAILGAVFLALIAYGEPDPRTTGKVRLNLTDRANRIVRTASLLFVVFLSASTVLWAAVALLYKVEQPIVWWWAIQILIVQSMPFSLVSANLLLSPYEKRTQKKFLEEARIRIKEVDPFIIGITGSYGKTSTKLVLGEFLKIGLGPTFVPPKSFNTLMGNVREIRERLAPGTKYAVIEMGAYGIGSIKRLTTLTPPRAAIITAVGIMHLERFGSEENVFRAKSELAQALPRDGILVCNGDDPGARRMAATYPTARTLLYGSERERGDIDCAFTIESETAKGTTFTLELKGVKYRAETPLRGVPAVSNITGAFLMATELGAQPELLLGAIRNLAPVDNRLSVEVRDGVTYFRDAYNSNPVGFRGALEVLRKAEATRRLLMTPGMIELGSRQDSENESVAVEAAAVVQRAFIVGETNRAPLVRGLLKGGLARENIIECGTRGEALSLLAIEARKGDAVLIENDLTDLYEVREEF